MNSALGELKDFQWLITTIGNFGNLVINLPETLMFVEGIPSLFCYSIGESVHFTKRIRFNEIISLFMRNVHKRNVVVKNEMENIHRLTIFPSHQYSNHEIAVLKTTENGVIMLNNKEFTRILLEKRPKQAWEGVSVIQAKVFTREPQETCEFFPFPLRETAIPAPSCIKSIEKALFSLNFKLIQADFKFIFDDCNIPWLISVENLKVSKLIKPKNPAEHLPMQMSAEIRKVFLDSLEFHSVKPKSKRFVQLQSQMFSHYSAIKKRLSIDETLSTKFHLEVPEKTLPYLPETSAISNKPCKVSSKDVRNTKRTLRRLSFFQTSEFKGMRSQREKGRNLFNTN